MLGETGVVGRVFEAAEVRSTGRLPLQDWAVSSPAHFSPESGVWYAPLWEESERVLYHPIAHSQGGLRGVRGLELDLTIPRASDRLLPDFLEEQGGSLLVKKTYFSWELEEETYSDQELETIYEASGVDDNWGGYRIRFVVPVDPDHPLTGIYLYLEGGLWELKINRAELILR